MPVLGWLILVLAAISLILTFTIRRTRRWSSPSGAVGGVSTDTSGTRWARFICATITAALAYVGGFLLGWWA